MRKIVVTEFMSADGVMEDPMWTTPYWADDIAKYKFDELFASDAMLLGRITYQGFAEAWPGRTDAQGFGDRMNNLPKYVVSSTLEKAEWNNSHIIKASNMAEEIARLKQQDGEDILIGGSAMLSDSLIRLGLVDVVKLLVYPVVVGGGKRLFKDGTKANLKLADTQTFSTGVIALIYHPEPIAK
jgi:dihydrofolate reductase